MTRAGLRVTELGGGEPVDYDTARVKVVLAVKWFFKIKWEPRDTWLGVYWTRPKGFIGHPPKFRSRQWFICVVPCLPIIITRREQLR